MSNEYATRVAREWSEGILDDMINGMTAKEIADTLSSMFYEEFDYYIDQLPGTLRALLYDDEINWTEIGNDIYEAHEEEIDSEINAFFSNPFVLSRRTAFASETVPPTLVDNLYYFIGEYMEQDWYEDYGIGTYQYDIDDDETEEEYLDRLIEEVKDIAAEHNHVLRIDGTFVKFAKLGSKGE